MDKLIFLKMLILAKLDKFVNDEKGEVNIVAIVILIGIAVVLAIIFKDAISNLIKSLLNQIQTNANNVIQPNP